MFRLSLTYLASIGLSSLIALPFLWHLGLYEYQAQANRKEVKALFKAGIAPEELTYFEFSKAQAQNLEWEKAGREFFWQGHKYDVYALEENGDQLIISAWLDDKESALKKRFEALLKQHSPSPNQKEQEFFKLLKQQWLDPSEIPSANILPSTKTFFAKTLGLLGAILEADDPPPRNKF